SGSMPSTVLPLVPTNSFGAYVASAATTRVLPLNFAGSSLASLPPPDELDVVLAVDVDCAAAVALFLLLPQPATTVATSASSTNGINRVEVFFTSRPPGSEPVTPRNLEGHRCDSVTTGGRQGWT